MRIDRRTVVFFDASCLVAAAGSPAGGSGFLLSLCEQGLIQGAVSQPVLLEAQRNVLANLGPVALETYHRLVVLTPMRLVALPGPPERGHYRELVGAKDEHVVAAAITGGAPFLLTLDKKLADRVNRGGLPIRTLSPGEFIKTVLPQHADYPS